MGLDEKQSGLSRRDLLKHVGLAGVAAALPVPGLAADHSAPAASDLQVTAAPAVRREPLENLTAVESDLLEAICARIIPTDANGPGAREARAAHYIDRALGGALASSRAAYTAGLAALERYSHSSRRGSFISLSPRDQDSLLIDVETGSATGFPTSPAAFFAMVRTHTLQGTFGDPYYGGNANFVGWDLIGYPGVRTNVTADDQRLGAELAPNHKSAYDFDMFTKAQALKTSSPQDLKASGPQALEDHAHGD
jgi:gluconate 2-dehydrogenase gamma chain